MSAGTGGSSGGLLLFVAASALVIGLTYGVSRFLGNWQLKHGRARRMRVLEGIPAGRDRSLLLVAVGKELLVIGSSPSGFSTLHRVTDPADLQALLSVPEEPSPAGTQGDRFGFLEASVRKSLERIQALMARGGGDTHAKD